MATRGFSSQKDELERRLAKIEGRVRGLRRMVAEDAYCIDVLQVNATTAALRAVGGTGQR